MEKKSELPISQELREYFKSSNEYFENLLGYKPEQTKLQTFPSNELNHEGVYLPRNQTAIIQEGNPLSLFHEYFGHGLFCEQSLTGDRKSVG